MSLARPVNRTLGGSHRSFYPRRQTNGLRSSGFTTARFVALLLAITLPLRAHDIYSSWTETTLRNERLELTVTMARASAARLLANSDALPPITPENFAEFEPRLKAVVPDLFQIISAGKPLKFSSGDVKISGDSDITFHLVYPRPSPGPLRFIVNYLFRLVDRHVGTLVVSDAAGNDLGWSPVSVDQPFFEMRVPATATR